MTERHTVSEIYGWPDVWNLNHTLDTNHLRTQNTTHYTPTVSNHGIKKLENCYTYSSILLDKIRQDKLFLKLLATANRQESSQIILYEKCYLSQAKCESCLPKGQAWIQVFFEPWKLNLTFYCTRSTVPQTQWCPFVSWVSLVYSSAGLDLGGFLPNNHSQISWSHYQDNENIKLK